VTGHRKPSGGEMQKITPATPARLPSENVVCDEPDRGIGLWPIAPMVRLPKGESRLTR
jgi:hypothetical protein